ncbi:hypothetical protein JZ751_019313 [Albula glossodonta]|uniref:Uncharacterized protein n=1 Tax=Albula glossodonta TaxID=121402 RepID=A0A8T2MTH3_9TELE|nr:hypothetical protein JZ751_019313 [Albula glossodonta]
MFHSPTVITQINRGQCSETCKQVYKQMASPFTEMEAVTVLFSLLVFCLFTVAGMFREIYVETQEKENRSGRQDQEPIIV